MSRRKRPLPLIEKLEIIDAGAEGKAIAKHEDQVVFVTGVVPGDICDVQIFRKKRRFLEGRPTHWHKRSQLRVKAICKHFGICGGCKWQELNYENQLKYKQKQVLDNFQRLGKFDFPTVNNIIPSQKTTFYRNKLEFTFSNKKWLTKDEIEQEAPQGSALGFHVPGRFDKIVDINECHLQSDISNKIRNEVRNYALETKHSFFDLRTQNGLLRNLIIRTSTTGELMVIVVFYEETELEVKETLNNLKEKFSEITSLMYVINPKKNDTISDLEVLLFDGKDHLVEQMEDIEFHIGPKSFFQTNANQALKLYQVTRDFADLSDSDTVYDLYTGTGTIANFVARNCKKVVGVEYIPEAIEDAKTNSRINQIENTLFFAGDMKDLLIDEFFTQHGKPDVIITDPPRAGMHEEVCKAILKSGAKKIVYVSCNPATQARDLTLLAEKYQITKIQPVDMFPHTHHVENVVLLELL